MTTKKIAIVGNQCAGKTTLAIYIMTKYNQAKFIKFAAPIYAALTALGVPKHRAFMQEYSDLAKKHFGPDIFTDIWVKSVNSTQFNKSQKSLILCDDLRYPGEYAAAKELGFQIVAVTAPEQARRQRAEKLGLEFIASHSSEMHVEDIIKRADFTIKNHWSLKDFHKAASDFQ